jgi:hypothetical protein
MFSKHEKTNSHLKIEKNDLHILTILKEAYIQYLHSLGQNFHNEIKTVWLKSEEKKIFQNSHSK